MEKVNTCKTTIILFEVAFMEKLLIESKKH